MTIPWVSRASVLVLASCFCLVAFAAPKAPKVAVTDLAYGERVSEYFRSVSAPEKSSLRDPGRENERDADRSDSRRSNESTKAGSESAHHESEGLNGYIDRGELRKFTADIKGSILKDKLFELVQGRPFTAQNTEKLYDIIERIKKGMYPGADYVLFGTISNVEFRQEANPVDNTNTVSHTQSLELLGEFNLISTRTYKVQAAFSAMGEGQDVKLFTGQGGQLVLNHSKVIAEVSRSLGEDVSRQLGEQLRGVYSAAEGGERTRESSVRTESQREEVIIFK